MNYVHKTHMAERTHQTTLADQAEEAQTSIRVQSVPSHRYMHSTPDTASSTLAVHDNNNTITTTTTKNTSTSTRALAIKIIFRVAPFQKQQALAIATHPTKVCVSLCLSVMSLCNIKSVCLCVSLSCPSGIFF